MDVFTFDADAIARCIVAQDYQLFRAVQPSEFIAKYWAWPENGSLRRPEQAEHANLDAYERRFQAMAKWVGTAAITITAASTTARIRRSVVKKLLEVAECCKAMGDLGAFATIISGLTGSIGRAEPSEQERWEVHSRGITSNDFNQLHTKSVPPCIPALHVIDTMLKGICEMPDRVASLEASAEEDAERTEINFDKRRTFAKLVMRTVKGCAAPLPRTDATATATTIDPVLWNLLLRLFQS
jgi:hypothetical protein